MKLAKDKKALKKLATIYLNVDKMKCWYCKNIIRKTQYYFNLCQIKGKMMRIHVKCTSPVSRITDHL